MKRAYVGYITVYSWLQIVVSEEARSRESVLQCSHSGKDAVWVEPPPYQWNMKGMRIIRLNAHGMAVPGSVFSGPVELRNVVRSTVCHDTSDSVAKSWQRLVCWKVVVGWKTVRHRHGRRTSLNIAETGNWELGPDDGSDSCKDRVRSGGARFVLHVWIPLEVWCELEFQEPFHTMSFMEITNVHQDWRNFWLSYVMM